MTATPAKFTFDVDMGRRRERTRVLTEKQLAEHAETARKSGYEQGYADGEKSEIARAAQATAEAANRIAGQCAELIAATDATRRQLLGETVYLGSSIGRKLAAHLVAREPAAEIEALITECLASLDQAPHLVIRCHPDLADIVRETAEQKMTTSGFSGRLVVMGEPDIPPGDGRIEWADGGLVRDSAAILEQIDTCIGSYLDANGAEPAGETEK